MTTPAKMQAFLEIEPKLPARRKEVWLAVCALGSATLNDIRAATGRPLHCLSGRVTELAEKGWLVNTGTTRHGQTVWSVGDGTGGRGPRRTKQVGVITRSTLDTSDGSLLVEIRLDKAWTDIQPGKRVTLIWTR